MSPPPTAPPPKGVLALVIYPRQVGVLSPLPRGSGNTNRAIAEIVDGHFCTVAVNGSDWAIYVNEDGIPLGLRPNLHADALARALGVPFRQGDYLRGPAVVLGRDGFATIDVPADVIELARHGGMLA